MIHFSGNPLLWLGAVLVFYRPLLADAVRLAGYNVDPKSVTISGFSSGGAMAMQFSIAFSTEIQGTGIFSGIPFACGKEHDNMACMNTPEIMILNTLIKDINDLAAKGKIDPTINLKNSPVFIFHGINDSTVSQGNGKIIEKIYTNFGSRIQSVFDMAAEHGYPTDFYGAPCSSDPTGAKYIVNCDYQGAYLMLQHLYAGETIVKPKPNEGPKTLAGDLITFEQAEFVDAQTPFNVSLGPEGFLYVPSQCKDQAVACKFHIAFHGCTQCKLSIGDIFATKTGYLEVAELNNIIVLFPQAAPNELIGNGYGCWDWVGYQNANFLNKEGDQMKPVYKMLKRVVKGNGTNRLYQTWVFVLVLASVLVSASYWTF